MTDTRAAKLPHDADLAQHVEDTVQTLLEFHRGHHRRTTALQRALDRLTGVIGRPSSIIVIAAGVAAWVGLNWLDPHAPTLSSLGWLGLFSGVFALMISILILITQRREDELAERRAQFTLELTLLSDKKSAKIISLLEEMRRDHPQIADRFDAESEAMAKPSDTDQVLAAIDQRTTV